MYQAKCDYCGRVHSSKKLETLPQTCNSCHAVLPAPEWIDDDETSLDDIKDAVREVLDEREKKSKDSNKPQTHILPSEPKYTKDEEELKRISSELFDKCGDLTSKIYHTVSDSVEPVKDAIEKTKWSAESTDMPLKWFLIKSILSCGIVFGTFFLFLKTDRLNPLCGTFIFIMSVILTFNIPLPLLNKKKLTQETKDRYQAARADLDSWLKDYDISEKQVIRFMSEHKSTIRKSLISDAKTGMSQARNDINEELKTFTDEFLEESISDLLHQRRFERILAFLISLAIFLLVFPISSIERKFTPVADKKVVCTLSSKDLNDNSIIVADEKGREKKFCYHSNTELFQKYVTGDTIEIYISEHRDGRVEYHIGESSSDKDYTLLSPAEETEGE